MYDSVPVDDMDFEDIEWQKWLQGLDRVNLGKPYDNCYHLLGCIAKEGMLKCLSAVHFSIFFLQKSMLIIKLLRCT